MSQRAWMRVVYSCLAILNAALVALTGELAAGRVTLPGNWQVLAPVLAAALMAATALLPRVSDVAAGR